MKKGHMEQARASFGRIDGGNLIVKLYIRLRHWRMFLLLLILLTAGVGGTALIAALTGVFRSTPSLEMSYGRDFVAWAGMGIGIAGIAWYALAYLQTLDRALGIIEHRRIILLDGAPPSEEIRSFIASLNSRVNLILLLITQCVNIIWIIYIRRTGTQNWIVNSSGPFWGLTVAGAYYAFVPTTLIWYMYTTVAWNGIRAARFFGRLVARGEVQVNPFHPDRAGGLAFVGELGVRNVYPTVVAGVNIALVFFSDVYNLHQPFVSVYHIVLIASYLTIAAIIFFLPLAAFHKPMHDKRDATLASLDQRARVAYDNLLISRGCATDEALAEVNRIRATYAIAAQMPVWPFSFHLLQKFALSVLSPFVLGVLGELVRSAMTRQ